MQVSDHVLYAIDDAEAGKYESALLHACIGIDQTAKRLHPSLRSVRERYVACLRRYCWLLEPMIGSGINLEETLFTNVKLQGATHPDFAELIYEIFRCNHAHGDEVPTTFSLILTKSSFKSQWILADGRVHMPDRVVWALLAVAVFSSVNSDEKSTGGYYLSLGDEKFVIGEWWGREDDFRLIPHRYNKTRITLADLGAPWADESKSVVVAEDGSVAW